MSVAWPINLKVMGKCGSGWKCICPAHDDRSASLHLSYVPGSRNGRGRVLAYCHAGCSFQAVVGSLGVSLTDLGELLQGCVPISREPAVPRNAVTAKVRGQIVETYDYRDESGKVLFQVCRMDPKDFLQRRAVAAGKWAWGTKGVRKVLYRLPEIASLPRCSLVFFVEGERDVQTLVDRGLHATTSPGGASSWRPEMAEPLAGHRVVILPDNDTAGRKYATTVARDLTHTASTTVLNLPGLSEKGDVTDWMNDGHTVAELFRLTFEAERKGRE
jgi:putative DNA primase/helicase